MKFIVILLFAFAACGLTPEQQEIIANKVNKLHTTWEATVYGKEINPSLGAFLGDFSLPVKKPEIKNDLPKNFDLREAYPECESIKEIRDQANCGSCWAFGAAEAMSDRICIASKGEDQRRVSTQDLLTCCWTCGLGCNGGFPPMAWNYWTMSGIVTGGMYGDNKWCQPYFLPMCDHHVEEGPHGPCPETVRTPACKKVCQDEYQGTYKEDKIYGKNAYRVDDEEESIMSEIYEYGSVEASFNVYADFLTYKSGIYQHVTGRMMGGHAIKLIGWGEENGVKYWLAVNSWNDSWGEKGLFRILKGEDECGIESQIYAGTPSL